MPLTDCHPSHFSWHPLSSRGPELAMVPMMDADIAVVFPMSPSRIGMNHQELSDRATLSHSPRAFHPSALSPGSGPTAVKLSEGLSLRNNLYTSDKLTTHTFIKNTYPVPLFGSCPFSPCIIPNSVVQRLKTFLHSHITMAREGEMIC